MRNLILFTPKNYNYTEATKYRTNGPPSIGLSGFATIQHQNNKITTVKGGNPPKFYPSEQGYSNYLNSRITYKKDAGGGQAYHDASAFTSLRRINAIGKSSTKQGLPSTAPLSFNGPVPIGSPLHNSATTSALRRVRNQGCVAPKKKGAIK